MADNRMKIHEKLVAVLGEENRKRVFFQPPESVKLEYPCIIYERTSGTTQHGDDRPYRYTQTYLATIIDKDPESGLPEKLATTIKGARFDRHFTVDNLHHDTFYIPNY